MAELSELKRSLDPNQDYTFAAFKSSQQKHSFKMKSNQ